MIGASGQKSSHRNCKLVSVHLGHAVVYDYNVEPTGAQLVPALPRPLGAVTTVIPEVFEKSLFAFQHILVIVDAKNHSQWEFRISGRGMVHPHELFSNHAACSLMEAQTIWMESLWGWMTRVIAISALDWQRGQRLVELPIALQSLHRYA